MRFYVVQNRKPLVEILDEEEKKLLTNKMSRPATWLYTVCNYCWNEIELLWRWQIIILKVNIKLSNNRSWQKDTCTTIHFHPGIIYTCRVAAYSLTYLFHFQDDSPLLEDLNCVDFVKAISQNGFTFCLGYFSAVFPHISLCGHQSLIKAWLHMKWLDPILRCDRGLFCAVGSDGSVSELVTGCSPPPSPEVWESEGPPAPFVLLL